MWMRLLRDLILVAVVLPPAHGAADDDAHKQPAHTIAADSGKPPPKLHISKQSLASLNDGRELAVEVNAGLIPRALLRHELGRGIGRFLREVRTEPAFAAKGFAGWRVLELYKNRPEIKVQTLRPGDVVQRVNGQSLERPEHLKQVWDSLANADKLVLDIVRNGQPSKLHYKIY